MITVCEISLKGQRALAWREAQDIKDTLDTKVQQEEDEMESVQLGGQALAITCRSVVTATFFK